MATRQGDLQVNKKKLVRPLEVKSLDDKGMFKGFGSVFGNTDSYNDVVVSGAFTKDLQSKSAQKVKMLWQHKSSEPIGVYHSIIEKDYGLEVEGQLLVDDVQQAKEAYALLKAGAIDGLSIGYSVNEYNNGKDGKTYLTDLKLWEISIVTFPANDLATISDVKSMTIKDFERFLRDSGFSKSEALAIASHGYKFRNQREADDETSTELLTALDTLNHSILSS